MGDYRTTTGEPPPPTPTQKRSRRRRILLASLLLAVALSTISTVVKVPRRIRASGFVTSELYAEARVPMQGVVAEILINSGERVEANQLLMRLDDRLQRAALDEATSRLRQIEAELAWREVENREKIRGHHAEIELLALRERHMLERLRQIEDLEVGDLASKAGIEDGRMQLQLLQIELDAKRKRDLSVLDRELEVLRHEVEARRENVESAMVQLALLELRSPIAGEAVRHEFVEGELVRPETVLYEVYGGMRRVLRVRVPERHATRVAEGHPYRARLTSYGGMQKTWFHGEVIERRQTIQGDGASTFRTIYGNFDAAGYDVPLGASAEVWIDMGRVPLWAFVFGMD